MKVLVFLVVIMSPMLLIEARPTLDKIAEALLDVVDDTRYDTRYPNGYAYPPTPNYHHGYQNSNYHYGIHGGIDVGYNQNSGYITPARPIYPPPHQAPYRPIPHQPGYNGNYDGYGYQQPHAHSHHHQQQPYHPSNGQYRPYSQTTYPYGGYRKAGY